MPVVLVALPPHPETGALLTAVADAVAGALGLGPGDVIAGSVAAGEYRASGASPTDPWAVVTIHGSDRGAEPTAASRSAAEQAVTAWAHEHGVALGGTWVTWVPSVS